MSEFDDSRVPNMTASELDGTLIPRPADEAPKSSGPKPKAADRRPRRAKAASRAKGFGSHLNYIYRRNRTRILFVLGLVTLLVIFNGARGLVQAAFGMVAALPLLALQIAFGLSYIVAYFGFMFWFLSRPRSYVTTPDDPQVGLSFEEYRGQPDLLDHAKSTVKILRGEDAFTAAGGEMPKGMLLSGRPGTGKTFLAACIAAEAKLPFVYVDASSLRGMFWGMDSLMVSKLFRDARGLGRRYAPEGGRGACILFMDELDSIGLSRGGQQGMGIGIGGMLGGGSFGLNTLLNQMDSMTNNIEDRYSRKALRWLGIIRGAVPPKPIVFVIGATNRPEVLDPALTRPGRLDRLLEVYVPDGEGRRDMVEHFLSEKSHDPDINIDFLVGDSIGWTPIMIKTILNEALVLAYEEGRDELTYKDWLAAADARTLGLRQPIRMMPDEDRRAIAYHEAGHAVAAHYLQPENRIIKATIIRRGGALGVVQPRPKEERYTRHARQIESEIMVFLGSRAVEEEMLHTKMTGASSDLMGASSLALDYCASLGMGSGLLVMPATGVLSYPMPAARMADALLETLMEETKRLVNEKAYAVHAVAAALMEHGELIGTELAAVFAEADAANPDKSAPFERRLFTLPRLFEGRNGEPAAAADGAWPAKGEEAAAASMRPWVGDMAPPLADDGSAGGVGAGIAPPGPFTPGVQRLPPMPPPVWPAPPGHRGGLYTPDGPLDPRDPHAPPPTPTSFA
jgi:cell division protease FtsH